MKVDFVKNFTVPDKSLESMAVALRQLQGIVMEQSKEIEQLTWLVEELKSRQP
jgi:hypothetical protein